MQKFEKRRAAPKAGNKWYTRVSYGGFNNNESNVRHPRFKGSACDNCAGYTPARYWEAQAINGALFGAKDAATIRKTFATRKKGESPVEMWAAYKADPAWKSYCKQTPKQGAMVFYKRVKGSGYKGHMNFVEAVDNQGRCAISNNNFETSPRFSYRTYVKPSELYDGYFVLLGYVWPIADFEGTQYTTTDALHCRKTPGGEIVGTFAKGALLTVAGDHKTVNNKVWKYVKGKDRTGKAISGYVSLDYLK